MALLKSQLKLNEVSDVSLGSIRAIDRSINTDYIQSMIRGVELAYKANKSLIDAANIMVQSEEFKHAKKSFEVFTNDVMKPTLMAVGFGIQNNVLPFLQNIGEVSKIYSPHIIKFASNLDIIIRSIRPFIDEFAEDLECDAGEVEDVFRQNPEVAEAFEYSITYENYYTNTSTLKKSKSYIFFRNRIAGLMGITTGIVLSSVVSDIAVKVAVPYYDPYLCKLGLMDKEKCYRLQEKEKKMWNYSPGVTPGKILESNGRIVIEINY